MNGEQKTTEPSAVENLFQKTIEQVQKEIDSNRNLRERAFSDHVEKPEPAEDTGLKKAQQILENLLPQAREIPTAEQVLQELIERTKKSIAWLDEKIQKEKTRIAFCNKPQNEFQKLVHAQNADTYRKIRAFDGHYLNIFQAKLAEVQKADS